MNPTDRINELKNTLADAINRDPNLGNALRDVYGTDIYYAGPLAPLLEFFQDWRSEIEELG